MVVATKLNRICHSPSFVSRPLPSPCSRIAATGVTDFNAVRRFYSVLATGVSVLACWAARGQIPRIGQINPMRLQADYVTLSVGELKKEEEWYERVLGFHAAVRQLSPTFKEVQLSIDDGYHIDLVWQKGSERPAETGYLRQGWMHVVFTTPAIGAAYDRLKKLRTDVHADYNDQGHIWRIYLHDPERNEIEIVASSGETLGVLNLPVRAPAAMPAGESRSLVIRTCTGCHSVQTIIVVRRTKADWKRTIARMIGLGAIATTQEQGLILNYLNTHFGRAGASNDVPSSP